MNTRLLLNLVVAGAAFVTTAVAVEIGLRIEAHLENRGLLDTQAGNAIPPPADGSASLGHLIRLSENRRIIYELEPELDLTYAGARVRTNQHGFRGPARRHEKGRRAFRIVGLGDSFMFGYGVGDGESYLALLEQRLRRRERERRTEVINTAVPGYNTVMEVETLKEKGLAFEPDLVILEFVGNDLSLPNFIRRREDVLALDRSFFADFVRRRLASSRPRTWMQELERQGMTDGLGFGPRRRDVPPEYADMVGWPAYAAALRELRELSRRHGFAVLVITLAPSSPKTERAFDLARRLGFHTLDVGVAFRGYLTARGLDDYFTSPLALSADDGHPSALGHRIAARALVRHLLDKRLLERRAAGRQLTRRRTSAGEGAP